MLVGEGRLARVEAEVAADVVRLRGALEATLMLTDLESKNDVILWNPFNNFVTCEKIGTTPH